MRRLRLIVCGLLAASPVHALDPVQEAEIVAELERTWRVAYRDGEEERYRVHYRATLHASWEQTGSSIRQRVKGKGVGNVSCSWVLRSRMSRRVFLLNRAGLLFELEAGRGSLTVPATSGLGIRRGRDRICREPENQLSNARTDAASSLRERSHSLAEADSETVRSLLREILGAPSPVPLAAIERVSEP